jgi:hypothetical protein
VRMEGGGAVTTAAPASEAAPRMGTLQPFAKANTPTL